MNKLLLYVLLTFLARVAVAQQVDVDYNHALNFVEFRTYAWGQQSNPNQIVNSFLVQEVKSQINAQLRAKGLMLRQENEALI